MPIWTAVAVSFAKGRRQPGPGGSVCRATGVAPVRVIFIVVVYLLVCLRLFMFVIFIGDRLCACRLRMRKYALQ